MAGLGIEDLHVEDVVMIPLTDDENTREALGPQRVRAARLREYNTLKAQRSDEPV